MRKALIWIFALLILTAGCTSRSEGPVLPSQEIVLPTLKPAMAYDPGGEKTDASESGPSGTQPSEPDPAASETQPSETNPAPSETRPSETSPVPSETRPSETRPSPSETRPSETSPSPSETRPSETRPGTTESPLTPVDPTVPPSTQPSPTNPPETKPTEPPETKPTEPPATQPTPTDPPETRPTEPTQPPATSPTTGRPEDPDDEPPAEELQILSVSPYAGPYFEDGSDEEVLRVASLLVQNPDKRHLQYAELHLTLDGKEAVFRISDLPPGKTVLVLEANRLEIYPDPDARLLTGKTVTVYQDPEAEEEHPELSFRSTGGNLTVTNKGRTTVGSVDVTFKIRRDGETFLGGVSYHVRFGKLAPGESRTLPAAHFDTDTCEIVFLKVT